MGKCKYIIGYLILILLFYSCFLILFGAGSATFGGFGNPGMIVYSNTGLKWLNIIGCTYLTMFLALFLFFLFSFKKEKIKWYGLKASIILILSFVIGVIIVPNVFFVITTLSMDKIAFYVSKAGWTAYAVP